MKKSVYENQEIVPVGFLDPANSDVLAAAATTATAYSADTVVRVAPTAGDTWIAIGTSPTATADTDGSHFIPFGGAQDFALESGDKINTTAAICVTPFK